VLHKPWLMKDANWYCSYGKCMTYVSCSLCKPWLIFLIEMGFLFSCYDVTSNSIAPDLKRFHDNYFPADKKFSRKNWCCLTSNHSRNLNLSNHLSIQSPCISPLLW